MAHKLQRDIAGLGMRGFICPRVPFAVRLPRRPLAVRNFSTKSENAADPIFAAAAASGRGSMVCDVAASATNETDRLVFIRLAELVRAYRAHGHCLSTMDPLDLPREAPFHRFIPKDAEVRLSPATYGLSEADLSRVLPAGLVPGHMGTSPTVGECISNLRRTYCGDFAVEFSHLPEEEQRFFVERVEHPAAMEFTKEERLHFFKSLSHAVLFERFCTKAFPTVKRFGADGLESMVVSLNVMSELAESGGADSLLMGMSHRGRLNVLVNVLNRPLDEVFAEFRGKNWYANEGSQYSGDVKYHFGYVTKRGSLRLEMLHNASHLQFVHPVVAGQARARQIDSGLDTQKVIPIVLHGDAAFAGEGVTFETIQMSRIPEYAVGGTINVVVNNQIGFTTYPSGGSSTRYTTDVAKMVESPALHANAQNVEAVVLASRLAFEYRQRFGKDVFVNLVGFRKYGHNELDMPKFTNADMYARVEKKNDVLVEYRNFLLSNGAFTESELSAVEGETQAVFEAALKRSIDISVMPPPPQALAWKPAVSGPTPTGVEVQRLVELGKSLNAVPADFQLHPAIKRIFKERVKAIDTGSNIDTGLAEALAYASLAQDGFRVRLVGQDSKRGTFSHRHSTVQCQKTFRVFNIFSEVPNGDKVEVYNSLLSETAAMAFEYGYGLESTRILNIWEAQFGDFANVAQTITDEFIVSGETKWAQRSAMCLLLPHGYDGQGPDHSSARVERYLQLSDEPEDLWDRLSLSDEDLARRTNIAVINCTRSSNLFHALRRQMLREFHKPLIVMSGKKLLKLRGTYCSLEEFGPEHRFRSMIPATVPDVAAVDTLILCSGQVYFDLADRVAEHEVGNVAVSTVEQLCPLPVGALKAELERYPNLKRLVWCQEEHANAGGWGYVAPRIGHLLSHMGSALRLEYHIQHGALRHLGQLRQPVPLLLPVHQRLRRLLVGPPEAEPVGPLPPRLRGGRRHEPHEPRRGLDVLDPVGVEGAQFLAVGGSAPVGEVRPDAIQVRRRGDGFQACQPVVEVVHRHPAVEVEGAQQRTHAVNHRSAVAAVDVRLVERSDTQSRHLASQGVSGLEIRDEVDRHSKYLEVVPDGADHSAVVGLVVLPLHGVQLITPGTISHDVGPCGCLVVEVPPRVLVALLQSTALDAQLLQHFVVGGHQVVVPRSVTLPAVQLEGLNPHLLALPPPQVNQLVGVTALGDVLHDVDGPGLGVGECFQRRFLGEHVPLIAVVDEVLKRWQPVGGRVEEGLRIPRPGGEPHGQPAFLCDGL
ncbi:2-oxoglutarate dehydrogenase E1 component [Babesia caballi]|uniref:2-oxoglutarate dehydrogenase E1 component n=1 Tax=Babesia caballi TaxID=5871 RepID=A0AAV4LWN9_BABCB|nr:2-oxoglutarate dehydrogenase E1 component [Babesia caballi]